MSQKFQGIINALEKLFPGSEAKEEVDAVVEMDQRAQAAGFETKAVDAEAGTKALAAAKELEAKLGEAHILITKQAGEIAALTTTLAALQTAQQAHQARGEKAIGEVKSLLVTLNAKPELTAPAQQAQLAAMEEATKAKIEAAEGAGKQAGGMGLQRTVFDQNGTRKVLVVQ